MSQDVAARKGLMQRALSLPQPWFLVVMLGLALAGMAVASAYEEKGRNTWIAIAVGYAAVGVAIGWPGARARRESVLALIARNIGHWAATAAGLAVLFAMERQEFIQKNETAAVAVLMLSLSCFLAGVHLNWLFFVAAVLLALLAYLDVRITEQLWLIVFTGIAFLAAAVGFLVLLRRRPNASTY